MLTCSFAAVQVTRAVTQAQFNAGFVKLNFSVVGQPMATGAAQLSHTSVSAILLPETRKMDVVVSLSSATAHTTGRAEVPSWLSLGDCSGCTWSQVPRQHVLVTHSFTHAGALLDASTVEFVALHHCSMAYSCSADCQAGVCLLRAGAEINATVIITNK